MMGFRKDCSFTLTPSHHEMKLRAPSNRTAVILLDCWIWGGVHFGFSGCSEDGMKRSWAIGYRILVSRGAEQNELAIKIKFSEAERGLRAAFQALHAKGTALQEDFGTPLGYGGEAGCTPAHPFGAQTNNLTLLFFSHHNWGRIRDPTTRQHIRRAQGRHPKPPSPRRGCGRLSSSSATWRPLSAGLCAP